MMLALNLIPEDYQDKYRLKKLYGLLKTMLVAIIIYTIIVAILLLLARLILRKEFNRIVNETTLVTLENRTTEKLIISLNNEIDTVASIQNRTQAWTSYLLHFSKLVPEGVTLSNLTLDTEEGGIITGVAKKRIDLLSFKQLLTSDPSITDVNLPITDLLSKEDINFKLTFNFDLDEITRD